MGVYIKGMEMPKNCLSCPLQGGTADCRLTQKTYNWGLTERPSDCPLVPVPPHGRLIDADVLVGCLPLPLDELDKSYISMLHNLCEIVPTIIPADKESGE